MTAAISIDTSATTPLQRGFSGVNTDLTVPLEYWDQRFNALAQQINYGWLRFPSGTTSDIYDWQTGEEPLDWYNRFSSESVFGPNDVQLLAGRGGARLIDAAERARRFGASLIICANGFTDTAESIGRMAAFVRDHQIPVAAWELCNEPYLFPEFFLTATDYLDRMKTYRDAIKAIDRDAIVSIFVTDQAKAAAPQDPWNLAIAAYPHPYWDAISFHHYPAQSGSTEFAQWMKEGCAVLASETTDVITTLAGMIGPPGVKFLNTEFDPTIPNSASGTSITDGTLWGAIYSAEYIMRMSTLPSVLHVGPHQIADLAGVSPDPAKLAIVKTAVENAYAAGTTVDTATMDFGFFITAQACGLAVLNSVMKNSVRSHGTTVNGGDTVPASGLGTIPALYAMTYAQSQGELSLVITNKSVTEHSVTISVDGKPVDGPIRVQFIGSTDPSALNSSTDDKISIQYAASTNPITVPPYSVLRADLTGCNDRGPTWRP